MVHEGDEEWDADQKHADDEDREGRLLQQRGRLEAEEGEQLLRGKVAIGNQPHEEGRDHRADRKGAMGRPS